MSRSRRLSLVLVSSLILSPPMLAAQVVETIHVVITGGANAGTYDANPTEGGCSYAVAAPDAWASSYRSDSPDPKKLSYVGLIIPDSDAAAHGTSEFYLSVGFGPVQHLSAEFTVQTRTDVSVKQEGSGTATVAAHGATATISFAGQTAAGAKLQGTVECKSVYRNPG